MKFLHRGKVYEVAEDKFALAMKIQKCVYTHSRNFKG